MEQIKTVIKPFFGLLIMAGCVILVIHIFFLARETEGIGIFEQTGNIFRQGMGSDELENNSIELLEDRDGVGCEVIYNQGAQQIGEVICFKDALTVIKTDETKVVGSLEDDFAIYLQDITTQSGNSAVEILSQEEIEALEEIPAPMVYDKENDQLYCFVSGIYIVYVKIYDNSGGQQTYVFQMPVDTI